LNICEDGNYTASEFRYETLTFNRVKKCSKDIIWQQQINVFFFVMLDVPNAE
jgi:hypothetical protein